MASDKKRPSKLYRLFDSENGFFRIMAVVFDLIELNVLTLLCCVPVVTAGASFTAMHNTLWHMVRHEEGYVHTHFFRAFKENFKQATVVWLVCLAIIIVMLGDIAIMGQLDPVFRGVLLMVLVIVGLAAVTIAQYYFVFLSRYDNPVKVQLRNAAMAAIGFFPRTAGMLVILRGLRVRVCGGARPTWCRSSCCSASRCRSTAVRCCTARSSNGWRALPRNPDFGRRRGRGRLRPASACGLTSQTRSTAALAAGTVSAPSCQVQAVPSVKTASDGVMSNVQEASCSEGLMATISVWSPRCLL